MGECELLDLNASRRTGTKAQANLQTAMEEAAKLAVEVQGQLVAAQLSALMDWSAAHEIEAAQEALQRLGVHLQFVGALARRADRARKTAEDAAERVSA